MDKRRVAICFFGQTRTFQVLNKTYKSLQNDNIEFDFFVSTWDDFQDKSQFDFCQGREFIDPNIIEFKNNTDRAAYTIHRVNLQKSKYELENNFIYDYVMWTRSEVIFKSKDLIDFFKEKVIEHTDIEINIQNKLIIDKQGYYYAPADHFFMGTSLSFDLYSTGWKLYFKNNLDVGKHGGHNFHAYVINKLPFNLQVRKLHHTLQFMKGYPPISKNG
ncbi:hypothetical protein CMI47_00030 [Candidatus Pacearchaeota archaeon]|nr:hypothetical protein [Candidatus Pacearchaeota archaeon]|tara:strand:+ start:760 stop:1410 length:651 start_codon:yes stop_codon:yes gene_type:complete